MGMVGRTHPFVESTTWPARILQDYTQLIVNPSAQSAFHSDPISVLLVARAMPAARAAIKGGRPLVSPATATPNSPNSGIEYLIYMTELQSQPDTSKDQA